LAESFGWRLKRSGVQLGRERELKMAVRSKKEKEHLNLVLGSHLATIHETLQVITTPLLSLFLSTLLSITIPQHLFLHTPSRFWIEHRRLLRPKLHGTMS